MALSKLSGDEQGIILGQLCNTLEPRLAMYFSSACTELRVLLTPAMRQQLRADYEAAAALCLKMGTSCKGLREAQMVRWMHKGLTTADLATLGTLVSVMPALERLCLDEDSGWHIEPAAGPDGVQRLAKGLNAGAWPAVTMLQMHNIHVGDAGASALAAALGRCALPRLNTLELINSAIGDVGLVALAPALRQLPALESLTLAGSVYEFRSRGMYGDEGFVYDPFNIGDEGLTALVAPLPPAGALPPSTGALKRLKSLDLSSTQITDAGCAALAAALKNGALPALKRLNLQDICASADAIAPGAIDAVYEARAKLLGPEESGSESGSESEENEEGEVEEEQEADEDGDGS